MAFAVRDARAALDGYRALLDAGLDATITDFEKSRTRVALFRIDGVEYQLCESMDPDGRFAAWIDARGVEGLHHHICYAVPSIDDALVAAQANGATLRTCKACGVAGSHSHPEGYVAFLETDLGGIEIEFMQLYSEAERQAHADLVAV